MNDKPETHGKAKARDCVIDAGAAMIALRHVLKSPEDAKKVGMEQTTECIDKCFADVEAKVDAAIDQLTDPQGAGVMTMRFGKGLRHLQTAKECAATGFMRPAYIAMLEAHDAFERVLTEAKQATPTNQDISTRIALVNRR